MSVYRIAAFVLALLPLYIWPLRAQIEIVQLVHHDEMQLAPADIVHLPGLGLGLRCGADSIMFLDDPALARISFFDSGEVRSPVALGGDIYAAEADSIVRLASDSAPRRFIGRLDNASFTLSAASDSTLYACTADEEFSCVYEIFPSDRTCAPVIAFEAPILKISRNGAVTMLWVDDSILRLASDGAVEPVYRADDITDMALTPLGVMVGTGEGIYWLTGPDTGALMSRTPVEALWWDDTDALYCLTAERDLIAVIGLLDRYREIITAGK